MFLLPTYLQDMDCTETLPQHLLLLFDSLLSKAFCMCFYFVERIFPMGLYTFWTEIKL